MYVLPPNALINYPLSRPTAVASYLKDLKVHDVIQLALWMGISNVEVLRWTVFRYRS